MVLVESLGLAAPRLEARALWSLAKPRLSAMVLCTTAAGMRLAPGALSVARSVGVLVATALVVAAANGLNCYLERDTDALMRRTSTRALPSRRVDARLVKVLSLVVGASAMVALSRVANPPTVLLSFAAFALYGWVYTPMKRHSPLAVLVGAVPGAIPPLLGYTAVTGTVSVAGLSLFGLLFVWQLPHFLAISVYLQDDYARGGLKVFPLVYGVPRTVQWMLGAALLLLPAALWPWMVGMTGPCYAWLAVALTVAFVLKVLQGLRVKQPGRWARQVFLGSVIYLGLLLSVLLMGA